MHGPLYFTICHSADALCVSHLFTITSGENGPENVGLEIGYLVSNGLDTWLLGIRLVGY